MKTDYYVYVYSDPDTKRPIYVGKGHGSRARFHLSNSDSDSDKGKILSRLEADGKQPIIELVAWNVSSETAYQIESALIQYCGVAQLTNIRQGKGMDKIHVDFLRYVNFKGPMIRTYRRPNASCKKILWLKVDKKYSPGMNRYDLYEAIRGPWKVDIEEMNDCDYIFCLLGGFVLDVYKCPSDEGWLPAGMGFRRVDTESVKGAYEFTTKPASGRVVNRYVGRQLNGVNNKKLHDIVWCEGLS